MAGEEYSITANADANWGAALDLSAISYDRGIEPIAEPDFRIDVTGVDVDKGFSLSADPTLGLGISLAKNVAISAVADTFNDSGLFITPATDLAFQELSARIESLGLSAFPAIDISEEAIAEGSFNLSMSPTIDQAIGGGNAEGQFHLRIDRLLRSLFTAPPDAEITVLKYMTSEDAETLLDGCTVEAGVTTILQLQVLGSRLDTYLVEFFVRINGDAVPVIYKSSSGSPGGIRLVGINNKATPSGTLQELIAQIILEPADTKQFEATTKVLYECRMSHKGFGEDYRIAPKKDRGETGLFTIAKY